MKDCPCGSGEQFVDCCKDIIAGVKLAVNPLELMRSRYTAHIYKDIAHILRTMRGKALKLFDKEKTEEEWFEQCNWVRLEIVSAPEISKNDKQGIVEFKAYYILNDVEHIIHERGKFLRIANKWYYVSAQNKNANIGVSAKIGRNDLCVCGSGRKNKKCCASMVGV